MRARGRGSTWRPQLLAPARVPSGLAAAAPQGRDEAHARSCVLHEAHARSGVSGRGACAKLRLRVRRMRKAASPRTAEHVGGGPVPPLFQSGEARHRFRNKFAGLRLH